MQHIKEWVEENEQELVEAFCELHEDEFNEYNDTFGDTKVMVYDEKRDEYHDESPPISYYDIDDRKQQFANTHKEWVRFLECEYGSRGAE